jgi:hypothetical protein
MPTEILCGESMHDLNLTPSSEIMCSKVTIFDFYQTVKAQIDIHIKFFLLFKDVYLDHLLELELVTLQAH